MNRIADAWERFWFEPQPVGPLVLVRIAFGFLVVAWAVALLPDLDAFFGPDGALPNAPRFTLTHWSVLSLSSEWWLVVVLWIALLVAAVALMLGLWTRAAALVVFVAVTSFERRTPGVFNAGDGLIRLIALYLVLAPAGAALGARRAPWALRLMQIQLSVIYIASVLEKLRGDTWPDGTALAYALRIEDVQRIALPDFVATSAVLVALLTWGTIVVELAAGTLVWVRRFRPWVLGAGAALHVGIGLFMEIGFFTPAMLTLYLAFVPPERATAVLDGLRARLPKRA